MGNMKKPFWRSKAKIGAILAALGFVGQYLLGNVDIASAATGIAGCLSVFGIRDALK